MDLARESEGVPLSIRLRNQPADQHQLTADDLTAAIAYYESELSSIPGLRAVKSKNGVNYQTDGIADVSDRQRAIACIGVVSSAEALIEALTAGGCSIPRLLHLAYSLGSAMASAIAVHADRSARYGVRQKRSRVTGAQNAKASAEGKIAHRRKIILQVAKEYAKQNEKADYLLQRMTGDRRLANHSVSLRTIKSDLKAAGTSFTQLRQNALSQAKR